MSIRSGMTILGTCLLVSTGAAAQVGHLPSSSPFHDLEHTQELGLSVGQFHGHRDPANVGPQSGLLLGLHYEWRPTGPIRLIGDLSQVSSQRRRIDPLVLDADRELGTEKRSLLAGTVGLGVSLTGAKSWHHLVPELAGGLGFVSDLRNQADPGGFKFGTRFAINWGGGISWVPGNGRPWKVRADLTNRMYTIAYPEAFYIPPSGGTAVVPSSQSRSFWTNNPAFTLGIARLF